MGNKTLKQAVLNSITLVFGMSENSELKDSLFELADKELDFLAGYFRITKSQALFVAVIFTLNYKGRKVDLYDLNSHFDCNPMKILEFSDDFVELFKRRLIRKNNRTHRLKGMNLKGADEEFYINEIVSEKILMSEPIPEVLVDSARFEDIFTLLEKLSEIENLRSNEEISTNELFEQAKIILQDNTHFKLIDKAKSIGPSIEEKYLFFYVVWKFLDGEKDPFVERTFKGIYDKSRERLSQIQRFLSKDYILIKEGWLEIVDAEFFDDARMKLTDKSLDLLIECDIKLFNKGLDNIIRDNLIQPNKLAFKNLFYNENEAHQMKLLINLLSEENLKTTQERLKQKSYPKGVTVLMHGAPGTGKTESVLQIAKSTNREIMKVDISASRSMWFGHSEKIIKQIFKDYNDYVKTQKQIPILFFNEADGIIAKRKEAYSSNTSDTENRIQNILLEEIENFEGVLIATSNLVSNMDFAFERRFLFKIEFQKPSVLAKSKIWKFNMPHLSMDECETLAKMFDFSGGQIDNIVRKNEINEVLYGTKVDFVSLLQFCREEVVVTQFSKTPVGFMRDN